MHDILLFHVITFLYVLCDLLNMFSALKWDLSDKVCGKSPLPCWMKPEYFLKKQMLNANERAEALKRAKGFKSEVPFFMVSMRPSFVEAKQNMVFD